MLRPVVLTARDVFDRQWREGDLSGHREWIARLLGEYYDPMYEYQLSKRQGEQIYRGERRAVVEWIRHRNSDAGRR